MGYTTTFYGQVAVWVEKCRKRHPDYNHKGGLMLVEENNTHIDGANYDLSTEDVISVIFTATPDLTAAPASTRRRASPRPAAAPARDAPPRYRTPSRRLAPGSSCIECPKSPEESHAVGD